jgi:hypothetical protein
MLDGETVAFNWAISDAAAYQFLFCGIDYARNRGVDLYFNVRYAELDNGLRSGRPPHLIDDHAAARDFFLGPEPDNDPVPPRFFALDALRQTLDVSMAATASSIWKLTLCQPIDLAAVRHLLTSRYGWDTDDVPFLPSERN